MQVKSSTKWACAITLTTMSFVRAHLFCGAYDMRFALSFLLLTAGASFAAGQEKPPIHLWFEPEWFEGVKGSFNYWTGTAKPTGSWGIAGPGISAEWSQGG